MTAPMLEKNNFKRGTNYLVTRSNDVNEHTHTDNVDDPHSKEFH